MSEVPTFKQFLDEAGVHPVDVRWTKKGVNLYGEFEVKGQIFDIQVTTLDSDVVVYQFKFYRDGDTKMFNDMIYALSVVPTIKKALDYAMEELNPDIVVFASSDKSIARRSMYKVHAEVVARKYGYLNIVRSETLKDFGYGDDVIFGVYRNEDIMKKAMDAFN